MKKESHRIGGQDMKTTNRHRKTRPGKVGSKPPVSDAQIVLEGSGMVTRSALQASNGNPQMAIVMLAISLITGVDSMAQGDQNADSRAIVHGIIEQTYDSLLLLNQITVKTPENAPETVQDEQVVSE